MNGTSNISRQAQVISSVVAAIVGHNISIQNLEESVTIAFRIQNDKQSLVGYTTVY